MKIISTLIIAALLVGCDKPVEPESTSNVGNGVALQKLFEKDGCSVYRFGDRGRDIYWSNCQGSVDSRWSTTNGKGVTTQHQDQSFTNREPVDRSVSR